MGTREITFCDGCGKELTKTSDTYKINMKTGRYCDAAGSMDYNCLPLEFCFNCANNRLLPSLEKIAKGIVIL